MTEVTQLPLSLGEEQRTLTMVAAGGCGTKEGLEHVDRLFAERVHREATVQAAGSPGP